jgi:hypothetical protein
MFRWPASHRNRPAQDYIGINSDGSILESNTVEGSYLYTTVGHHNTIIGALRGLNAASQA